MGNKAKTALSASVDCNDLIDNRLWKAHWKRGNETIKSTKFVQYQSCLIRRMRMDDKVRATYLHREGVKMNNMVPEVSPEVKAYMKALMENVKKIEKKHYDMCIALKGKY